MGLEEEQKKASEEAAAQKAALVIQYRWREYLQQKEEMEVFEMARQHEVVTDEDAYDDEADHNDVPMSPEERRQALVDEYRRLISERETTIEQNIAFQRIISRYLLEKRNRRSNNEAQPVTAEAEQHYWTLVRQLADERKRVEAKKAAGESELERLRDNREEIINEALMQEHNFREYIKELASTASYMRSNRPMPLEEVQQLLNEEEQQRAGIREARVRLFKLQNFIRKIQQAMEDKDRQNRNTGMYLIDFEQLKIENTNLSEKIEERNEDISKLRRKVTTTIHVLTHMKEKLEFMCDENDLLKKQVVSTEEELGTVRDQLAQTKKRRDGFASSNAKMKEKMPLVGSDDLLIDFEKRKEAINKTRVQVIQLTERHKELSEYIQKNQPLIEDLKRVLSNYPS